MTALSFRGTPARTGRRTRLRRLRLGRVPLHVHHGARRSIVTDIDIRYLAMGRIGPIHSHARLLGDAPTDAIAVELYDRGRDDRIIATILTRAAAAPAAR